MLKIAGVLLVVVGIVGLVWGGIEYTTHEELFDIGPVQATREQEERIPVPPLAGALALAGGLALLYMSRR